ncbi:MAG TPA: hypothetical protein DCY04_09825 [Eubacterium sp.]|nr:hypothetical protein [Eubacterium sp.]
MVKATLLCKINWDGITSLNREDKEFDIVKIIKYINRFLDDDITLFSNSVQKFNDNKLYREINDMVVHSVKEFGKEYSQEEYNYLAVKYERDEFFLKYGIVEKD